MTTTDRPQNAHLLPAWQPGQSGNPAGRPKNTPLITPRIREYLTMSMEEIGGLYERRMELPAADAIALVMIHKAITERAFGDATRDSLMNRVDGAAGGDVNLQLEVNVGVSLVWSDGDKA